MFVVAAVEAQAKEGARPEEQAAQEALAAGAYTSE